MVRNTKKENPSRGYSNKIWKPRKKNLIAFGKRNAKNPNPNPIRVRKEYFFSLYIISIIITTLIYEIKSTIPSIISFIFPSVSTYPYGPTHCHPKVTKKNPYKQAKNMTICQKPQKSYQHRGGVINMTLCHPAYRTKSSSPKSEVIHQT
jgi:hypothetical protein